MQKLFKKMNWKKSSAILIVVAGLFIIACNGEHKKEESKHTLLLPIIGPKTIGGTGDTLYHTIGNFSLTNQYKENITQQATAGKTYVANFFFATCQSICPAMSSQLYRVQEAEKSDSNFIIISHSVNPMHDTAEVLLEYAGRYGAMKNKWHFLTGSKKAIYDLAKNDYLVNAVEDDGTAEGFIHSEALLLVDSQKRIRGIYDGTDSLQVDKLINDIKLLKQEQNEPK